MLTTAALLSHLQPPTQTINATVFMDILKMGDMTIRRHVLVTTLNCGLPLGIALLTQDLGLVIELTGSYCGAQLGFIFPGVLYLATYKEEFRNTLNTWGNESKGSPVTSIWGKICSLKNFYVPVLIVVYGLFILVTGMVAVIFLRK